MKGVKWIPQILLAIAFLLAGSFKLFTSYADLVSQLPWAEDFSPGMIKTIGLLEFIASLGLILPALLKKFPFLVPLSAIGLALTMLVSIVVHVNRGEAFWSNIVLFALCISVIWIRKADLRLQVGS
ncbi:MAG: DoxX family protein [Bacteroidota bacterium]